MFLNNYYYVQLNYTWALLYQFLDHHQFVYCFFLLMHLVIKYLNIKHLNITFLSHASVHCPASSVPCLIIVNLPLASIYAML